MRDFFKQSVAAVLLVLLMLCGCAPAAEHAPLEHPVAVPDTEEKIETPSPEAKPDTDATTPSQDAPAVEAPTTSAKPKPLYRPEKEIDKPFTVVVDAGHGGSDPGAIIGEVYEAHINLSVAMKLADILEQNGIEVIRSRTADTWVSLPDRYTLANEENADLLISVHCNIFGTDPDVAGLECYYREESPIGRALAMSILSAASARDEIKVRNAKTEDYQVLIHTNMPAVLVEMGFMTNPDELQKLGSDAYQQIMAEVIAEAVLKTLNS